MTSSRAMTHPIHRKIKKKTPIVQVLNAFGKTKLEKKIAAELRRQVLAKLDKK